MAGRFITLEGGEGAGKSTLARGLAQAIAAAGQSVVSTREPGGTAGANQIRALIVTGAGDRWSALTETLLLMAARNDHLERLVRPALMRGDWVVCDRYLDSTRAYQVAAGGLGESAVDELAALIDAPTPDLTLILDIDPAAGVARSRGAAAGETRFETRPPAFHARVREAFLAIAVRSPQRCAVIDAGRPASEVLMAARAVVASRLGLAI